MSGLTAIQVIQDAALSLLKESITILEYTSELRLLLDEEIDRARQLTRSKVPLTLLAPSESREIMEEARGILPAAYSFSASPSDMALSLATASITVITKGATSPYFGVLEFPIHREQLQLFQFHAIRLMVQFSVSRGGS